MEQRGRASKLSFSLHLQGWRRGVSSWTSIPCYHPCWFHSCYSDKSSLREKGFVWVTILGCSHFFLGIQAGRKTKGLVTLHSYQEQAIVNECMQTCAWLPLSFSFFQSWNSTVHIGVNLWGPANAIKKIHQGTPLGPSNLDKSSLRLPPKRICIVFSWHGETHHHSIYSSYFSHCCD